MNILKQSFYCIQSKEISIDTKKHNVIVIPTYFLSTLKVHGLLHLLGFDHEISEDAEEEMEKEEEFLLKSLGWKGKGLIQSVYDVEINANLHMENSNGTILFYLFISSWTFLSLISYPARLVFLLCVRVL